MWDLWWTKRHSTCFLPVLQLPLLSIPPVVLYSSFSINIQGWNNRPFSGISNSGLGSTPPQEIKKLVAEARLCQRRITEKYAIKIVMKHTQTR
jgi:hypothetical protein